MSSDPAIVVGGVSKVYRSYAAASDRVLQAIRRRPPTSATEFWALRGISFEVPRGETLGIVGRNGCGKSTLLQVVAGVLRPTEGVVRVRGRTAALLELGAGLDPELTGSENILVYGALLGMERSEIDDRRDAIVAFSELGSVMSQPVKTYSSGMFLRLAFSVAINTDPDVLIVDEALAVGDEAFQRRCFSRIEALRDAGVTILFVSHAASVVLSICDRALLLDEGEGLLLGEPSQVISQYHRLLHCPAASRESVREEVRQCAAAEPAVEPSAGAPLGAAVVRSLERDRFDPELRPKSTVAYEPRGASIRGVEMRNGEGEVVNVLSRGSQYTYSFEVTFDRDCSAVRFGMMCKDVVGVDLGGLASHPQGDGLPSIAAGSRVRVRIPFVARLAPGTYFANAGVVGLADSEEMFLHRILDAWMFRVALEADCLVTGSIDLSAEEVIHLEAAGSPLVEVRSVQLDDD
jgi:lipopolysaccharide transport system ATP-binding protein